MKRLLRHLAQLLPALLSLGLLAWVLRSADLGRALGLVRSLGWRLPLLLLPNLAAILAETAGWWVSLRAPRVRARASAASSGCASSSTRSCSACPRARWCPRRSSPISSSGAAACPWKRPSSPRSPGSSSSSSRTGSSSPSPRSSPGRSSTRTPRRPSDRRGLPWLLLATSLALVVAALAGVLATAHGRVADRVHRGLDRVGGRWLGSWLERNALRFQRTDEELADLLRTRAPRAASLDRPLRGGLVRALPRDLALPPAGGRRRLPGRRHGDRDRAHPRPCDGDARPGRPRRAGHRLRPLPQGPRRYRTRRRSAPLSCCSSAARTCPGSCSASCSSASAGGAATRRSPQCRRKGRSGASRPGGGRPGCPRRCRRGARTSGAAARAGSPASGAGTAPVSAAASSSGSKRSPNCAAGSAKATRAANGTCRRSGAPPKRSVTEKASSPTARSRNWCCEDDRHLVGVPGMEAGRDRDSRVRGPEREVEVVLAREPLAPRRGAGPAAARREARPGRAARSRAVRPRPSAHCSRALSRRALRASLPRAPRHPAGPRRPDLRRAALAVRDDRLGRARAPAGRDRPAGDDRPRGRPREPPLPPVLRDVVRQPPPHRSEGDAPDRLQGPLRKGAERRPSRLRALRPEPARPRAARAAPRGDRPARLGAAHHGGRGRPVRVHPPRPDPRPAHGARAAPATTSTCCSARCATGRSRRSWPSPRCASGRPACASRTRPFAKPLSPTPASMRTSW